MNELPRTMPVAPRPDFENWILEAEHKQAAEVLPEPNWRQRAHCKDTDGNMFFPGQIEYNREEAMKLCGRCAVRESCLEDALVNNELYGIRGGMTERERRKLRRSGKRSAA